MTDVSRETYELYGYPDMQSFEWVGTMRIPYLHMMTAKPSWDQSKNTLLLKCRCGRIGSLAEHDVDDDGRVFPSVVCMNDDCGFHEQVILDGWPDGG